MIPKVIYICHKNLDHIKLYSQKWKMLNPEYEIKLYDDTMCRDFLLKECGELHRNIFDYIPDGPIKADFWRVCIINKYGGLYVDADIEPLVPLNTYIEDDDEFVTCISDNFNPASTTFHFNPHFIYSNKDNPVLQNVINKYIVLYINKLYSYWDWSICTLMCITGITTKKPQVLYMQDKKYKFLCEVLTPGGFADYCFYNGVKVFNNRYFNYRNHNFI